MSFSLSLSQTPQLTLFLTRARKPGRRATYHPCSFWKGGRWEEHHLHRVGPGAAPPGQEGEASTRVDTRFIIVPSSQQACQASLHPSASSSLQVGILDVDLCGPSIPHMLRAQGKAVHQCDNGWVPVFMDQEQSISLMSVGFLLENPDDAVVWRGPKKHGKNLVRTTSPPQLLSASLLRPVSLLACLPAFG